MRDITQNDDCGPNPSITLSSKTVEDDQNTPAESSQSFAASLVQRCRTLLSELDAFKTLLSQTQRNPQIVEVRSLRSNVHSELKTLEKLADQLHAAIATAAAAASSEERGGQPENDVESRVLHALRSSNLPFYEAVWNITKASCTGLVAFGKRFYWDKRIEDGGDEKKQQNKDKRKSVFVDIVADDGEEWVKVSTISETRLLFEMAKKGWEADSESEDEETGGRVVLHNYSHDGNVEYDDDDDGSDDDDDEIELIKLAGDMKKAASLVRVNYKHPRLRFVIPKIEEGRSPEIDNLLKVIRSYGVIVNCGEDAWAKKASQKPLDETKYQSPLTQDQSDATTTSTQRSVHHLLPNRFKGFTTTLNVDCTLLLAVVSDLSHYKSITPSKAYHNAINRQIQVERERPLLPRELWPAMESHHLVCTNEAAKRMREIVDTIGTDTERERMKMLMGDPPFDNVDTSSLILKFQELSDYPVPESWIIPIKVVEVKSIINDESKKLPPVSQMVEDALSDINHSVFMYGWVSGMMTITSNRTVVKQIETIVETHRDREDLEGPLAWVCDIARSLIGKEKGRKP